MKNKNLFNLLGLDPQVLRGLPDTQIASFVKFAFRNLVMLYHEDRKVSNIKEEDEEGERRKKLEEIMHAHEILSTPTGRLEAFRNLRNDSRKGLLEEITSLEKLLKKNEVNHQITTMKLVLSQAGLLKQSEDNFPINSVWGGKLLITQGPFNKMWEVSLDDQGKVTQIKEGEFVEKSRIGKQSKTWFIEGSNHRPDGYIVEKKVLEIPKSLKAIGTMSPDFFEKVIVRPVGNIKSPQPPKKTNRGIPFHRMCMEEMLKYINHLGTNLTPRQCLILLNEKRGFIIPGIIKSFRTKESLKKQKP